MASTLVEWTGSAIISKLVDAASSYLGLADTEAELNRLKIALPKIKAVMRVAEALKYMHPDSEVNEWLHNFKLAFFAAEDVLDELKYRELEDMVKGQDQVGGFFSSIFGSLKRKFAGSKINKYTLRRLKEAVKMLDLVAQDVGVFFQFANALHFHGPMEPHYEAGKISGRETTSLLTESKVFGRKNEKARVIEWLKKPASSGHISAFCIVGTGGLGKTTLAQLIFEDISRENYFDEMIWVCVSTSFSVEDITRKILVELGEKTDSISLNDLQKRMKKKVHLKKVLFILDDIWNDDKICDWDKLIAPLKSVQKGSKILLTTRMESVAEMFAQVLNVDPQRLQLRGLEEQELLLLFNKYAFNGHNPNNHKDLQKIGNGILKKLWGSPLAAKVIGSLLNSNINFDYWNSILKYDCLINLEGAKDVADVLKLSYYHLPEYLQECFRFCSIFPKDHLFEKSKLIKMWMASGFLQKKSCGEERPEDVGEKYFNHLLRKSLFERHSRYENYYVMHDLLYELAQNVSKGECCRIKPNNKSVDIPITTKHVSVDQCEIKRISHLRNLRTLVITGSEHKISDDADPFDLPSDSLKTLRLLEIDGIPGCQLPEEIGSLIHFRYLNVRGGYLSSSHSLFKLYHLQVLEWDGEIFETTGLSNIVSLCYIKLPNMRNITGLHNLTSLRELTFFVEKKQGHRIDELKMLNNLRYLSVHQIENIENPDEAKNAKLSEKESLVSLSLNWTQRSNANYHEKIIDNLEPHPNLKELEIHDYEGQKSPIWMMDLPALDLSTLTLFDCPFWEDLPLFGQMPHLRELSLSGMNEVKEVDYTFDSQRNACAFPSLEKLQCNNMPKLKSCAGQHNSHNFPNLKELTIMHCPNLMELPGMPLSLSKFEVCSVGLNSLPDICHSSPAQSTLKSSLGEVIIRSCRNLKLLNGFLQQENLDLLAVVALTIESCENLVQLPISAFRKFESLKYLYIYGSPKLLGVDNQRILLPAKLQILSFGNCGGFDVQLLESASCLTTLHQLSILNSANITFIPFSENAFASLRKLHIEGCDKLVEYSSMEYAAGVSPGNNMASLKINELGIPHLSLLFIEPLRSLRFVRVCKIWDCVGFEALPEHWLLQNSSTLEDLSIIKASSLRSLPGTMQSLTALKLLSIRNAPLLEEIPKLPSSLIDKRIIGAGGRQLV
jgi:NB-ARC domain/Rx N-terminal domain